MNQNEMENPYWKKCYQIFTALLISLALTACINDSDDESGMAVVAIPVEVSAKQAVPTNASSATANGELTLNTGTGLLSGSLVVNGMITTVAHIHAGKAGTNGGAVITLDVDGNTVSVPETTLLTGTQLDSLQAGDFYVNLHSTAFPDGEIRAQLALSGVEVLVFDLNGENEVPSVIGAGSGMAYVTLNRTDSILSINITTATTTDATGAHIHSGFAGENGDVLLALVQDAADASMFSVSQSVAQSVIDTVDSGGAYLNVHTLANTSGELRAQILPAGVTVHSAVLSGTQEVPSVNTAGSGRGSLTLNSNANEATAIVSTKNLATASAAHVHSGEAGVNGDALFELVKDDDDASVWVARSASVNADAISNITAGSAYFNVHTPVNLNGEIRGQLSAN